LIGGNPMQRKGSGLGGNEMKDVTGHGEEKGEDLKTGKEQRSRRGASRFAYQHKPRKKRKGMRGN